MGAADFNLLGLAKPTVGWMRVVIPCAAEGRQVQEVFPFRNTVACEAYCWMDEGYDPLRGRRPPSSKNDSMSARKS